MTTIADKPNDEKRLEYREQAKENFKRNLANGLKTYFAEHGADVANLGFAAKEVASGEIQAHLCFEDYDVARRILSDLLGDTRF